jgi:hypothetical protein
VGIAEELGAAPGDDLRAVIDELVAQGAWERS